MFDSRNLNLRLFIDAMKLDKQLTGSYSMIATCEEFAQKHHITFNPTKSKLLCFNACDAVTPHIKLNGQPVSVVNYISDSIHDRHILNNICDLYQRSNLLISQFRSCDSETLDRLHKTYCMHMYGCELWNLSCSYINGYTVAWRKIKRRFGISLQGPTIT